MKRRCRPWLPLLLALVVTPASGGCTQEPTDVVEETEPDCGDGVCTGGELCDTCPADCSVCVTPEPAADETPADPSNWVSKWASLPAGGILKLAPGVYKVGGQYGLNAPQSGTTGSPITIRGQAGVVFDGDGQRMGLWIRDAHDLVITDVVFTDYVTSDTGIVVLERSARIRFERITMTNVSGTSPGNNDHGFYVGGGNRDLLFKDCGVAGGGVLRGGGFHAYHDPGPINVVIEGGTYTGCYWGAIWGSGGSGNIVRGVDLRGNTRAIQIEAGGVTEYDNLK